MVETFVRAPSEHVIDQPARATLQGAEPAACPACTSRETVRQQSFSAREAAQCFAPERSDPASHARIYQCISDLWGSDACHIMSCRQCGFGFAWPYVAGNAAFYNFTGADGVYPKVKWEFSRTAVELASLRRSNAKVLEVGAGNGYFLDLICPALVRPENVVTLEYNDRSIPILKGKGYQALSVDIRDTALDSHRGTFDFIFLFQVVEHLDRLDALFDRIRCLLKPGGSVFCAVPNAARIVYQETHASLPDLPPNHIGRWTPQAFAAISGRHGLVAHSSELEPLSWREFLAHDISYTHIRRAQVNPDGLVARIRSLPRGRARWFVEAVLAALFIPSRLGAWRHLYENRADLGGSLWVRLDRPEAVSFVAEDAAGLAPS